MADDLTTREHAFVEAYQRGLRGADAARAAGYKDGPGLAVAASKVLRRAHVRAALGLPKEARPQRRGTKKKTGAKGKPKAKSSTPKGSRSKHADVKDPEERLLLDIRDDDSQPAAQRMKASERLRELREERELAAAEAAAAEAPPEATEDPYGVVLVCNGRGPACGDTVACAVAHLRRLTPAERGKVFAELGLRVAGAAR